MSKSMNRLTVKRRSISTSWQFDKFPDGGPGEDQYAEADARFERDGVCPPKTSETAAKSLTNKAV
jgi:hypothetical protein